jgi:hypothetical protein
MESVKEQRICVKFCVRVGKTAAEAHNMLREVAEDVGVSTGSCHTILTEDLAMHRVPTKFVPRLLTDDRKLQRFSFCDNLLQRANDENLLKMSLPLTLLKQALQLCVHFLSLKFHFCEEPFVFDAFKGKKS